MTGCTRAETPSAAAVHPVRWTGHRRHPFTDREKLDGATDLASRGDVGGGHLGDALPVHVGRADPGVKADRGQDGGLGRGVEAVDVRGRVGLGVAQPGGLGQRLVIAQPGIGHRRQDEVGGAVDDPHDPRDPVPGKGFAQRPDQRDGAGDGRLEVQIGAGGVGRLVQFRAVLGQQRLVRGDHPGPAAQRGEQQVLGRLDAADHLDDHVDVVPGDQAAASVVSRSAGISGCRCRPPDGDRDQFQLRRRPGRPARRPARSAAGPPGSRRRRRRAPRPAPRRRPGHREPPGLVTSRNTRNA